MSNKQYKDYLVSHESFSIQPHETYKGILKTTPVPKNLTQYYKSENYLSHSDEKNSLFQRAYQTVKQINLKSKLKLIQKLHPNKGKILDYGCGVGDFLLTSKNHGWDVSGIEPSEKANEIAANKLNQTIDVPSSLFSYQKNSFDIITLWHVLEHIPNLEEVRDQLLETLTPNGFLIIAVPNYKSFDAKFYKEHWAAWDVPRHLWHFSKEGIQNLFREKDVELIKIKPMWFDVFYISLLSSNYKNNLFIKLLFPIIGLFSNFLSLFNQNCSSNIYIFQKKIK